MNEGSSNIEAVKRLIKNYAAGHRKYIKECQAANHYYRNQNDILRTGVKKQKKGPLRNADNRIPHNFHGLLVNQKASYLFTYPPLFNLGGSAANKQIADILGDGFPKFCKDLCVKASNSARAWLHYWKDDNRKFCYGIVDSEQIIPVYSSNLNRELIALLRTYRDIDFSTGKEITIWEYWDSQYCYAYSRKSNTISDVGLSPYEIFPALPENSEDSGESKRSNVYAHGLGRVPFICFANNNVGDNDLKPVKQLIDAYDVVYSGFMNDLEDIQEVIFVLSNYGGADLKEFISDLKEYKAIKVDKDETAASGGVETITINIPIEAREKFLEITRKAIFELGQGVDPDPQKFGNTSGEALKYLYSLLELKSGLMETEFRLGFGELVRVICDYLGVECKQITQTWTRNNIRSDSELADICSKSVGIISNKTILSNHPFVENAEEEEKQLKKEAEKAMMDMEEMEYGNAFKKNTDEDRDKEEKDIDEEE